MGWTTQGIRRLNSFIEDKKRKVASTVNSIGLDTYNAVLSNTPVLTGRLKSNITMDVLGEAHIGIGQISRLDREVVGEWYAEVAGEYRKGRYSYWRAVEFGSISHLIAVREGEYRLKLPPKFPYVVMHPGYTGARMFRNAIEDLKMSFSNKVKAGMK